MKDNNYTNNYCKKCFSNPCTCTPPCYDFYNIYNDLPDIQTSLESILDSEASISESASRLFNILFPSEHDSTEDIQKKINLFNSLLISYSNRSCSLGKLLASINALDETYVPNPHIDVFDDYISSNSKLPCDSSNENFQKLTNTDYKFSNPSKSYFDTNKDITKSKEVCNGIYLLEKAKIYFSKYNISKIFEIYFNSKTLKIIYIPSKNSSNFTKTYII